MTAVVHTTALDALFDTGANTNYISHSALKHIFGEEADAQIKSHPSLVTIANGTSIPGLGRVTINADINTNNYLFDAIVMPE